jgi:hypothetical protein
MAVVVNGFILSFSISAQMEISCLQENPMGANQGGFKWYSKRNANLVVAQRLITRQPAKSTINDALLRSPPKLPVFVPATDSKRA